MRRKQHRGRSKTNEGPLSIEKIESRFERLLEEKRLLAEAYMLGRNKYGNADIIPMRAAR